MGIIWQFGKLFFALVLIKKNPEDMPHSVSLIPLLLLVDILLKTFSNLYFFELMRNSSELQSKVAGLTWETSLVVVITSSIIMFATIYSLLCLFKKKNRLVQVWIAFLAADIILSLFFISWMLTFFSPILLLLLIGLLYWQFVVHIHLFKNSFDLSVLLAGLFALLYMLMQHNVAEIILGAMTTTG